MLRKTIASAIEICFCFLLQTVLFPSLAIGDIVPNILIILTVATAYMQGRVGGMYMGLICGLLTDLYTGSLLGLNGAIYMAIGFIAGIAYRLYYRDDYVMPVLLIGCGNLVSAFMIYVFEFLFQGKLAVAFYLRRIILPEVIYTVIVSIVLYKLLHSIHNRLERWVQKEVSM